LLTRDRLLCSVLTDDGRRVHGVLWVIGEPKRLALCGEDILEAALEFWRDDPTVRLPAAQPARRLALFRRT